MGLLEKFEKLINEHGSSVILREHLALVKAEQAALERKCKQLETENSQLRSRLAEFEKNAEIHFCDHCASPNTTYAGRRKSPTPFGDMGLMEAIYRCNDCQKDSYFELPLAN